MDTILFDSKTLAFRTYLKFTKESRNFLKSFIEYINSKPIHFESQKINQSIVFPSSKSEFDTLIEFLAEFLNLNTKNITVFNKLVKEGQDLVFKSESLLNESNLAPHIKHNLEEIKLREIEKHEIKFNMLSKSQAVNEYKVLIETIKNKNKCPITKLNPVFSSNFYEHMIFTLMKEKVIDNSSMDKDVIFHWVQNAFFFEKRNITTYNDSITKLNWIGTASRFTNWLFFIKTELVAYNQKNNTQFNDWMCMHFNIKNEQIKKGETNFKTIIRNMRGFEKINKSNHFCLENENEFYFSPKYPIVPKAH